MKKRKENSRKVLIKLEYVLTDQQLVTYAICKELTIKHEKFKVSDVMAILGKKDRGNVRRIIYEIMDRGLIGRIGRHHYYTVSVA